MSDAEEAARKLFAGSCDFVWGATSAQNLPPETLNEVAFVGRSNAGKSSLINALTGRKSLARLWLRQTFQSRSRTMAGDDLFLSAPPRAAQARGAIDRCAPRGDGQ